ncbi:GNAT family N-acetyltransferase [Promicromonospora sukumoe]|uniref:GNAT family N-acetyltransferase n=1 Tax=Promicromonospora sukumoe TaxID=88382 RepID=UPI0037C7D080
MDHPRVRETTEQDEAVVLQLMTEYMTWALATFEQTYGFAMGMDARHTSADLDKFRRPSGLLAIAWADGGAADGGAADGGSTVDGGAADGDSTADGGTGATDTAGAEPAGVAALRVQDGGVVEIKRMFVRPGHRGTHLGSEMLDWLLERSRDDLGARVVRLDSNRFMGDAHRLYESRGFVERTPYAGSEIPAELQHLWRFYELRLG